MRNEPVLSGVTALVTAGVGLLALFGLKFTAEETGALVAFVTSAYGIAALVRSKVTPTRKV